MKVGGLFSGIGGFELGLTRAGFEISWMVEIDNFCQKVLKKHWPNVPIYGDIKNVTKEQLEPVDLICGGFPCQPFSQAGKQRGKKDDRYLWPEMLRIIRELKPRWIIGENVAGFINMELENAFIDLESEGYQVEAFVLPACSIGLEHKRNRIWILAYTSSPTQGNGWNWQCKKIETTFGKRFLPSYRSRRIDGIPHRVDRLKSLGNAVVPQIPEILGKCILEIEKD